MPNIEVLKRSRTKLSSGDLFVMKFLGVGYLFGCVIRANIPIGESPMPGDNLIYVYRETSDDKTFDLEKLSPDRLLIPPSFVNRQPWLKGYFQTIAHRELGKSDVLERHCFYDVPFKRYVDDRGLVLEEPLQPCGEFGLHSVLTLDDTISEALGISPAE